MGIKVSSTVKLNLGRIRQLDRAAVTALVQTAEAVHTDLVQSQTMPRMDGTLQGEGTFVDTSEAMQGHVAIVSSTPYARRLYYHPEYHFHTGPWEETVHHRDGSVSHLTHEGNPNAGGKWFEPYLPGGEKAGFIQKTFEMLYKREAGV